MSTPKFLVRRARVALALSLLAAAALAACSDGPAAPEEVCAPARPYFVKTAWPQVFGDECLGCHGPGGVAQQANAKLQLLPATHPNFVQANLENISAMAKFTHEDSVVLIAKPLGELGHGGGAVLAEGSEDIARIRELIELLDQGIECVNPPVEEDFFDVALLDAGDTLRKASLELAGRLPTEDERARIDSGGDEALDAILSEIMTEDGFYDRLTLIFNDRLLTDRYLAYDGFALNVLNDEQYPMADDYYDLDAMEMDEEAARALRRAAGRAVAREPLDLINWIVRQDRPFTEILTADYTVMNPHSAVVYDAGLTFDGPYEDLTQLEPGQIHVQIDGQRIPLPHAGVLSSPIFLNRFPTSPTNRNRHRARMVLDLFLATDILRVAERPMDPTAATAYNNPTRENPACTVCHTVLDPIAGSFQKYNDNDPERFEPDRVWHAEMFPPGFGDETMSVTDYGQALPWIAQRIVADPRFVQSVVRTIFTGFTGRLPVEYPTDPDSGTFDSELAAWEAQAVALHHMGRAFEASDYDLKTLVKQVVLSPYFRAYDTTEPRSEDRYVTLDPVGTGRFLTPQRLSDKIAATTGARWARGWDQRDWLTSSFTILYGGIDSFAVTDRLTEPNAIMSAVAERMSNEVACLVTAWDFTKPKEERTLFPYVSRGLLPETQAGAERPMAIELIKQNLQHLHERFLGEVLPLDGEEIERTYQLFFRVWKAGRSDMFAAKVGPQLPWPCQGRWDRVTGEELPEERVLNMDDNFAVRSWMAVVTYLLSDWHFLHE